jgi:predicted ATPase/DNA-binding CsgD family transcriptional regulator
VGRLLRSHDARLVTLVGPPGVGKTRLALAVADRARAAFAGEVWFVELAPLSDATLVASAVAGAMGVAEPPGGTVADALTDALRPRRALLVLDNFEHVLAAAPLVAALLARCPRLRVLTTSRAPLHLRGEHEAPLAPLAVPGPDDPDRPADAGDVAGCPAGELFVARAQAVRPDFVLTDENAAAVAEVCRRLDGLPLALELAAARLKVLSPAALLTRLDSDRRLPVLTGGPRDAPARHRTLREAVAWSEGLLREEERVLFRRLGVFAGGFTVAAAEAVCRGSAALDGLTALVDGSLLRADAGPAGEPRFTMLETVRGYALERLAAHGEEARLRWRHVAHFVALAEAARPRLHGRDQEAWLDRLEAEHHNLRAALDWTVAGGRPGPGLRLAGALWWFWLVRGHLQEGRRRLQALLALADAQGGARDARDAATRALALRGLGVLAGRQRDLETARRASLEALDLCRALDDQRGAAETLNELARTLVYLGDSAAALPLVEEGVALGRALGDPRLTGLALQNLGSATFRLGDYAAARPLLEEAAALLGAAGDAWGLAMATSDLGHVARGLGDLARARTLFGEALAIRRALGDRFDVGVSLGNLAAVAVAQGDGATARRLLTESAAALVSIGVVPAVQPTVEMALGAWAEGHAGLARDLLEQRLRLLALLAPSGAARLVAGALEGLAWVAGQQGQTRRALRLAGAAAALAGGTDPPRPAVLRETYPRWVEAARRAPGGALGRAAWADGQAMTLEQAIAYATRPEGGGAPRVSSAPGYPTGSSRDEEPGAEGLTRREQAVAALVAGGLTNRQIAAELVVSPRTVGRHVEHILNKLGVHSRAEVAAWAAHRGLVRPAGA